MSTNKSALLVMDVQGMTIGMLGANGDSYLSTLSVAIQKARANNVPIIYVVIAFREGYPELVPTGRTMTMLKTSGRKLDTPESFQVHATVAPVKGDITVIKKRVSAFSGSDLEIILRSQGINHLVLTGIATSGVVLSTLREASDMDYTATVLSDCCADMDEEVHRVLTTKVFARQAEVVTAAEWKI